MSSTNSPPVPVFAINNYGFSDALAGRMPASHLFGGAYIGHRYDFVYAPGAERVGKQRSKVLRLAGRGFQRLFGSPRQAFWALREERRRGPGIVWVCTQASAPTVLVLRRLGILKSKTVVLLHSIRAPWWHRMLLRYADSIVTYSEHTRICAANYLKGNVPVHSAPWGPDLEFSAYKSVSETIPDLDVVSVGKTHRDYSSLMQAIAVSNANAVIRTGQLECTYVAGTEHILPSTWLSFEALTALIRRAACIAIPVRTGRVVGGLVGLTELADAIALGRPVLMPRNPELPFDIEAAGVGYYIDATAEPSRYVQAIAWSAQISPDAFVDVRTRWNQRVFAKCLEGVFDAVNQPSGSPANGPRMRSQPQDR